jgi:hypothetical protein
MRVVRFHTMAELEREHAGAPAAQGADVTVAAGGAAGYRGDDPARGAFASGRDGEMAPRPNRETAFSPRFIQRDEIKTQPVKMLDGPT